MLPKLRFAAGRSCSVLLSIVLIVLLSGCVTPVVHGKWLAEDAIKRVHFAVDAAGPGRALLRWRVESRGLADRRGEMQVALEGGDCDFIEIDLASHVVHVVHEGPHPRWLSLDPHVEDVSRPDSASDSFQYPCRLQIRGHEWNGDGTLYFGVFYLGREVETFSTLPSRRNVWLPVYPLAVITDTVLAAPLLIVAVVAFAIVGIDDFSWTPGKGVNWHREQSQQRRSEPGQD